MKIYKLLVCAVSGHACAILEVKGNKLRSSQLTPDITQAIEKDPLKMVNLEYFPENGVAEELPQSFKIRASVAQGGVSANAG